MAEDKDPGFIKLSKFMLEKNHPADNDDLPGLDASDFVEPTRDDKVLAGLLYSMLAACQSSSAEQMHAELIAPAKTHPTIANIQRFKDMILDPEYMGARLLYYTAAAMFIHACKAANLELSYQHIDIREDGEFAAFKFNLEEFEGRAETLNRYCAPYFSTVASCYVLGALEDSQSGYAAAFQYGTSGLKEEDKAFAETFIVIVMIMLCQAMSFIKIIDNTKLNEWYEKSHLSATSNLDEITEAAAEFFG